MIFFFKKQIEECRKLDVYKGKLYNGLMRTHTKKKMTDDVNEQTEGCICHTHVSERKGRDGTGPRDRGTTYEYRQKCHIFPCSDKKGVMKGAFEP